MRLWAAIAMSLFMVASALAGTRDFRFSNIDGGTIEMSVWAGQSVLVVNTASQCAFTRQYGDLQTLYDRYRSEGLIVFAVPSDDFNQELSSAAEVKEFCELNFALDLPMADITRVKGPDAHPFYQYVQSETGFVPRWNFNKVLLGPDGAIMETWGSRTRPLSPAITQAIEALLDQEVEG